MRKVNTNFPVLFQKMEEHKVEDNRFMKVKIWLMHLGENFNGSYFSKEVVERAIPSLANTPILGYMEPNSKGENDLSDHRRVMERMSSGEWRYKNAGVPFGTISKNNNAQFEYRLCDDGVEREFLTVEGLLWTKWQDSIDIMDRDVVKNQSMELHDDHTGYLNNEDGMFHFTDFKFYGACILGLDCQPAMMNSTIELDFELSSIKELNDYMQDKMEMFKSYSLGIKKQQEGGENLKKKLELLEEFSITEKEVEDFGVNMEKITMKDLEAKIKQLIEESKDSEGAEEPEELVLEEDDALVEGEEETNVEGEDKKQDVTIGTISIDLVEVEKVDSEEDEEKDEDEELEDELDEELKNVNEDEEEELISFSEVEELKAEIKKLKEENKALQNFKKNTVAKERSKAEEQLFSQYEVLSDLREFEMLKVDSGKFEKIEDLEKELALLFVKNKADINFSKNEINNTVKFEIDNEEVNSDNKRYGDLFERYGK